ncbi:hypothetical protein MNBD_ALPHA09-1856 [hydrothermal vent metagenome]|uniref:Calcineurin-like phosphoesterase domain-containing protein n=1 Tax=hydrothermal vent metagenome TaxID=652676 RepID=A0A3B0TE40_9ZZZZ
MNVPVAPTLPPSVDLGSINGPVLICGGANSNLEAFNAMLAEADRRGIGPSHIIHTGDVVAYCADPVATAEALRSSGIHAIKGNVEMQLAQGGEDCGCGFGEGSVCSVLSGAWYGYARSALSPELCRWMGSLPEALTLRLGGRRLRVIHGGVSKINRYVFASLPDDIFNDELDTAGTDVAVGGHCGLPFTKTLGNRQWHNSGALGLPANDGTPRVWVSVLQESGDGIRFEHVPLTYDHKRAARKMRERGLPDGYAQALETGLWPSLDILPPRERGLTGIPF